VLPLIALANAGVHFDFDRNDFSNPVSVGIFLGLVIGKPLGILLTTLLLVKLGLADFPDGITRRQLVGAACLCGIGFSESLFFSDAAFAGTELLALSKFSVLAASVVAALMGWVVLRASENPATAQQTPLTSATAAP